MRIEGYVPHGKRHETDSFHMWLDDTEVAKFLRTEIEANGRNRRHAFKVLATLEHVRRNGLTSVHDTTLFTREGKFPSGQPGLADMVVYVAKSDQVRVYGGLISYSGNKVFLCPEATTKKRNRANQEQLKRVAKVLGRYHDR